MKHLSRDEAIAQLDQYLERRRVDVLARLDKGELPPPNKTECDLARTIPLRAVLLYFRRSKCEDLFVARVVIEHKLCLN